MLCIQQYIHINYHVLGAGLRDEVRDGTASANPSWDSDLRHGANPLPWANWCGERSSTSI
jgi:hypothetical protein